MKPRRLAKRFLSALASPPRPNSAWVTADSTGKIRFFVDPYRLISPSIQLASAQAYPRLKRAERDSRESHHPSLPVQEWKIADFRHVSRTWRRDERKT